MNFSKKLVGILQVLLTYYLSAKYICFGIPKLLHMQFNILRHEAYTPLAQLTKYDHMWSFFGRSYNYNLFLGLIEILIGILVVFKRTRLIALLMLLGVSTNILILNIEFDIDFAIGHVAFDLMACLLLLLPFLPDLREFFLKQGGKMKLGQAENRSRLVRSIPLLFVSILTIGYFIFSVYIKNLDCEFTFTRKSCRRPFSMASFRAEEKSSISNWKLLPAGVPSSKTTLAIMSAQMYE